MKRSAEGKVGVHAARDVAGGRQLAIELDTEPERVPGILLVPSADERAQPAPAVLLLHGFTSRKERMAEGIGRALLHHGVASLAIDLPLHGAREGRLEDLSPRNPLRLVSTWRMALGEAGQAFDCLESMPAIDAERLALIGYSLGAYLGVTIAASERRVRAVALAAGGDLPEELPLARLVRTVVDPRRAVRALAGRPLLMLNGRYDRTIRPAQAERLYESAGEPKQLRWYQGGHWPPTSEIEFAARWMAEQLREARTSRRAASEGRRA